MFTQRKDELVYRRTVRAFKKHTWTVVKQMTYAALMTAGWYWSFWHFGWHYGREDKDIFLAGVLFLTSGSWIFKATKALDVVWDDLRIMVRATKRVDRDTIIDLREDHIPLLIPYYLILLAVIIELVIMTYPFESPVSGCFAIFTVTLVFFFYAAVVYELEDPTEGGWVRSRLERFDKDLLTLDVERVFDRRWRDRKKRSH